MARGSGVMRWALASGLAVGLALSARAEEAASPAQNKSCPLRQLASIEVRITPFGQVLVPVNMSGHDVWMTLDLQAGILALYESAIADWHLDLIRMNNGARRITFNGHTVNDMVHEDFKLGPHTFSQWPMIVVPASARPAFSFEGKPVVGQLAGRFLTVVDAELNLAHNTIILFEQVKCGSDAVYWGGPITAVRHDFDQTGLLHFPMELDGQEIQTSFNTDGGHSRILSDVTKKYFGFDENSPGIQSELQPNGRPTLSYRAMDLTAPGLDIKDAKIVLRPMLACHPDRSLSRIGGIDCTDAFGVTPFEIGTDLLRQLRVYIATKEKMVYFSRLPQGDEAAAH